MPEEQSNQEVGKDLNARPETIKLLRGKHRQNTLDDINQSKILYDPPLRIMEIKSKQLGPD